MVQKFYYEGLDKCMGREDKELSDKQGLALELVLCGMKDGGSQSGWVVKRDGEEGRQEFEAS